MKLALSFSDVLLVPKYSEVRSRKDVDTSSNVAGRKLRLPIISSNMDTVTGSSLAMAMNAYGAGACLHRFQSIEDNVAMFLACNEARPFVSVGLGYPELDRAKALYDEGASWFVLDVAHGGSIAVVEQSKALLDMFRGNAALIVGNFATGEVISAFEEKLGTSVAAYKVGIGGGCFASGTRILMANGTYKNIEDIKLHERVINKEGKAVEVIGTKFSGFKKVVKYKNNKFYKETFVTPEHLHWVGDFSTTKEINSVCIRKILDQSRYDGSSKFGWKEIISCNKAALLLPKEIQFELPKTFSINLGEFYESRRGFKEGKIEMKEITPSYDLGYLIGTFLGDGNSKLYSFRGVGSDARRNTSAATSWYFGKGELSIAEKVVSCLKAVFDCNARIKTTSNMHIVRNQNNFLARFFLQFGKRTDKQLPNRFLCSNKEYLKGVYDGMLDSDGHYGKDGRDSFYNTSSTLIETMMFLSYVLKGVYPSSATREKSLGGLVGGSLENCKESYFTRTVGSPEHSLTKDYQLAKLYAVVETELILSTYDIEVNCETHSFIANNAIVHNSACTTRVVTGAGMPTFASILSCANNKRCLIADGGIRGSDDFAKALAAGASAVMIGRGLAGSDESPGKLSDFVPHEYYRGEVCSLKRTKPYRGSASQESYEVQGKVAEWRVAEGESFTVPYTGPVANTLQKYEAGLRSSMSYMGASTLREFQASADFVQVTQHGSHESGPHGKR